MSATRSAVAALIVAVGMSVYAVPASAAPAPPPPPAPAPPPPPAPAPPPPGGASCNGAVNAPSYTPDPILGSAADQYFGDAEIATIPSTSTIIGIPDATAATGTYADPATATSFAAAFLDETELYEYLNNSTGGSAPNGSPGAYDASQSILSNLPTSGTITHADGSTSPGAPGLPYAAVFASDSSGDPVGSPLAVVPVKVTSENYTPSLTAWMPPEVSSNNPDGQPPTTSCGNQHYAALTFSVAGVSGLTTGTTYIAYLLVRDTDVSGPLANHIWYFTPPQPPSPLANIYLGYADSFRDANSPGEPTNPTPWLGSSNVIFVGCNTSSPTNCPTDGSGSPLYDAGAIRIDNVSTSTITVTAASVTEGSCTLDPWGSLDERVPVGSTLILTETGGTPPCDNGDVVGNYNFDTSEYPSAGCTNDGVIPQVSLTVDGETYGYADTNQVLNTGGVDVGSPYCTNITHHNETEDWSALASIYY